MTKGYSLLTYNLHVIPVLCSYLKNVFSLLLLLVWILVFGMFSSLLNMLWDITLYHVISDGEEQNLKRQSKLLPYYLVHFAFRSFALATFFIYWKVISTKVRFFYEILLP